LLTGTLLFISGSCWACGLRRLLWSHGIVVRLLRSPELQTTLPNRCLMSIVDIGRLRNHVVWRLHDVWAFCGAENLTEEFRWTARV
jgi:hypothetical protein